MTATNAQDAMREAAARAALSRFRLAGAPVLGAGTGRTVEFFLRLLANEGERPALVCSSIRTTDEARRLGFRILNPEEAPKLPFYVDSADEVTASGEMIKGGLGALTREKVIASLSSVFVCVADPSKHVERLGAFPVAVEVVPFARAYVHRVLRDRHGEVHACAGTTDNGNPLLRVHCRPGFDAALEENFIQSLPGVVACGIFAERKADYLVVAREAGGATVLRCARQAGWRWHFLEAWRNRTWE